MGQGQTREGTGHAKEGRRVFLQGLDGYFANSILTTEQKADWREAEVDASGLVKRLRHWAKGKIMLASTWMGVMKMKRNRHSRDKIRENISFLSPRLTSIFSGRSLFFVEIEYIFTFTLSAQLYI